MLQNIRALVMCVWKDLHSTTLVLREQSDRNNIYLGLNTGLVSIYKVTEKYRKDPHSSIY